MSIRRLDWRIGLLLALGSAAFALGAFPDVAARTDPTAVGTFFAGSCSPTAVQLAGTLVLNWTTLASLNDALDTEERIRPASGRPTTFGSICFLAGGVLLMPRGQPPSGPARLDM